MNEGHRAVPDDTNTRSNTNTRSDTNSNSDTNSDTGVLIRLSGGPQDGRVVRVERDQWQAAVRATRAAARGDSHRAGARVVWRDFDDVWVLDVAGDAAVYVQQRPPHEPHPS